MGLSAIELKIVYYMYTGLQDSLPVAGNAMCYMLNALIKKFATMFTLKIIILSMACNEEVA